MRKISKQGGPVSANMNLFFQKHLIKRKRA